MLTLRLKKKVWRCKHAIIYDYNSTEEKRDFLCYSDYWFSILFDFPTLNSSIIFIYFFQSRKKVIRLTCILTYRYLLHWLPHLLTILILIILGALAGLRTSWMIKLHLYLWALPFFNCGFHIVFNVRNYIILTYMKYHEWNIGIQTTKS